MTNPGGVIFDRKGKFFATKCARMSALLRAFFPMRPHACTEGTRRSGEGEGSPLLRAVSVSIGEKRREEPGARRVQKIARPPLMRERPLAPLMTCSRVLA